MRAACAADAVDQVWRSVLRDAVDQVWRSVLRDAVDQVWRSVLRGCRILRAIKSAASPAH